MSPVRFLKQPQGLRGEKMKKVVALIIALMTACLLTSCGEVTFPKITEVFKEEEAGESGKKIKLDYKIGSIGEPSKKVKPNVPAGKPRIISITLAEKVLIIPVGKTGKIEYSVKPKTAYDKSVYYEVSDESIASVDKDGNVLGKKPGAVTITVRTNDQGFKRQCTAIVTRGEGDAEKSAKVVELINAARVKNGYEATPSDNRSLQAAADQRAFEEAVDMVNYGEKRMDDKRMTDDEDGKRVEMEQDVFKNFNIWSKESKEVHIWGEYTAEQVYKAFIEDDECAEALGVRGSGAKSFQNIAVGYYEFDGITYWSILMTSES